jgi:hypothetical protein
LPIDPTQPVHFLSISEERMPMAGDKAVSFFFIYTDEDQSFPVTTEDVRRAFEAFDRRAWLEVAA